MDLKWLKTGGKTEKMTKEAKARPVQLICHTSPQVIQGKNGPPKVQTGPQVNVVLKWIFDRIRDNFHI